MKKKEWHKHKLKKFKYAEKMALYKCSCGAEKIVFTDKKRYKTLPEELKT